MAFEICLNNFFIYLLLASSQICPFQIWWRDRRRKEEILPTGIWGGSGWFMGKRTADNSGDFAQSSAILRTSRDENCIWILYTRGDGKIVEFKPRVFLYLNFKKLNGISLYYLFKKVSFKKTKRRVKKIRKKEKTIEDILLVKPDTREGDFGSR